MAATPSNPGRRVRSAYAESDPDVLKRLMQDRFTCRAYRPDDVPDETVRAILDIARHTASWCNVQPWQVVVASHERTEGFRAALMTEARDEGATRSDIPFPPGYQGVYKARRQETGYALYAALGIERDDYERRQAQAFENFRLFGAPRVAIVTVPDELGPYGQIDCGAFIGAFLLAARAHGIATSPQAALARYSDFIRGHFDIPEGQNVVCGISFGYADEQHPANGFRTSRAELDEIMRKV